MHIDFNADGTAQFPEMHIHPDLSNAARMAFEELEKNPGLNQQFRRMISEKREEWRAREADRKLVG
jgi:hypothetical protein